MSVSKYAHRWLPAAALILGLAGCGAGSDTSGVATADGGRTPTPTASTSAVERYVEAQRAWVACLRDHGFTLPDPDAKGYVDFSGLFKDRLSKTDPQFVAAQTACHSLQIDVPAELQPSLPPLTPEQLENRRKYAKCMRANGWLNYPDPLPNGDWPDNLGSDPIFSDPDANDRALQVCDPVLDGRPPASYDPSKKGQG